MIQGMSVYPIAGYLVMAIEAARRLAEKYGTVAANSQFEFREVSVGAALVLTDGVDVETTITLKPYTEGTCGNSDAWDEFRICSWNSKRNWTQHCTGLVKTRPNKKKQKQNSVFNSDEFEENVFRKKTVEVKGDAIHKIETENLYKVLSDVGAGYGLPFQGLENCFSGPHHSRADLYVRDTKSGMPKKYEAPLTIHPTFLDTLLHLVWPIIGKGRMELGTLYMPTRIKNLVINGNIPSTPGDHFRAWCIGGSDLAKPEPTKFDLWVTPTNSSEVLINMEGLIMTPINDTRGADIGTRDLCYKLEWKLLAEIERAAAEGAAKAKETNMTSPNMNS
jgi:hypothetical protein